MSKFFYAEVILAVLFAAVAIFWASVGAVWPTMTFSFVSGFCSFASFAIWDNSRGRTEKA
jgi:hypothetical protein